MSTTMVSRTTKVLLVLLFFALSFIIWGSRMNAVSWITAPIKDSVTESPTVVVDGVMYPIQCHDFFTVLATAWLPDTGGDRYTPLLQLQEEQLFYYSAQMELYASTLFIYITPQNQTDRDQISAWVNHFSKTEPRLATRIKFVEFDPEPLLRKYGFTDEHLNYMKGWWSKGGPTHTRLADMFRLVLQAEYNQTYVDFDMLLLPSKPTVFQVPFVSVGLWQDHQNGLEVTNAIFCLPKDLFKSVLKIVLEKIIDKGPEQNYYYTEMGPVAISQGFLNRRGKGPSVTDTPVLVLNEGHPLSYNFYDIAHKHKMYNHTHLHVTGYIRTNMGERSGYTFLEGIQRLRILLGAAPLTMVRPYGQPLVIVGAPVTTAPTPVPFSLTFQPPPMAYHEYWMTSLHEELGPLIGAALYDQDMFVAAAQDPTYLWSIPFHKGFQPDNELKELPRGLHTAGHQLVFLKRSLSAGLGRMHRDAGLEYTYSNIQSERELTLFTKALRHFIAAQGRHLFMFIQAIMDATNVEWHAKLTAFAGKRDEYLGGSDPMYHITSLIRSTTTPDEVDQLLRGITSERLPKNQPIHRAERVMTFDYNNVHYDAQMPKIQKYFSLLRPTGACHTIHRECELPDGCRFMCNLEYMQNKMQDGKPFGHRLLGLGSNNDFSWELSMMKQFDSSPNSIHSLTTFDCTLATGFLPPPHLMFEAAVGWGGAEICLGETTKGKFMSFADLKKAVLDSEVGGKHIVRPDIEEPDATLAPNAAALAAGSPMDRIPTKQDVAGKRIINRYKMGKLDGTPGSAFDSVSVFKTDIEGWEFALLPAWCRAEYEGIHSNEALRVRLQDGKTFAMVDFIKEIEFFSVSQFLLEIHASGHGYNSLWHMEHMMLQLHQMGFVMVQNEKNFYTDCCYEVVFVHYRYFVRSEMFMAGTVPNASEYGDAASEIRRRTGAPPTPPT